MRHAFAEAGRHSIFPTDAGYGFPGMQSDDAAPLVRDLLGCNHA